MSISRRHFLHSLGGTVAFSSILRADQQPAAEYDVIVVGAGSSGCVLANRLSADGTTRVLVVEAGGPPADAALAAPGRWVSLLGSQWDWNYATEPDPGLDGRSIRWPRGRVYGGSSAINAMAYVRSDPACYDAWARESDAAWSYAHLAPLFDRLERDMTIADTRDPHAGHVAFLEGARSLGLTPLIYPKTIHHGRRQSAFDAFLLPAMNRANLTVSPHTRVRRVAIDGGRATGLDIERNGTRTAVRAAREVVLCAGVIESPKILMLSGVGPAAALAAHGIAVVADSPGVGANLHDHPRVSVRWKSVQPLAPSTTSAGLFAKSAPEAPIADLQFYVGRGLDAVDDFITLTVALTQQRSRGAVALRSADPSAPPLVRPNYFAEAWDVEALSEGVRLAREIAATRAFHGLRGDAIDPVETVRSPADIRAWIRRTADTIFHPVGTCRMGRGSGAVVDPQLRVRGVERLRVADGSVMPTVVNGQTNAACLVIGEHAARLIRG